jgi:hypothetical protein
VGLPAPHGRAQVRRGKKDEGGPGRVPADRGAPPGGGGAQVPPRQSRSWAEPKRPAQGGGARSAADRCESAPPGVTPASSEGEAGLDRSRVGLQGARPAAAAHPPACCPPTPFLARSAKFGAWVTTVGYMPKTVPDACSSGPQNMSFTADAPVAAGGVSPDAALLCQGLWRCASGGVGWGELGRGGGSSGAKAVSARAGARERPPCPAVPPSLPTHAPTPTQPSPRLCPLRRGPPGAPATPPRS